MAAVDRKRVRSGINGVQEMTGITPQIESICSGHVPAIGITAYFLGRFPLSSVASAESRRSSGIVRNLFCVGFSWLQSMAAVLCNGDLSAFSPLLTVNFIACYSALQVDKWLCQTAQAAIWINRGDTPSGAGLRKTSGVFCRRK